MPNVEINFCSVLFWYLFDVSYILELPVTMLIHATSFVGEAYDINDKIKILIANLTSFAGFHIPVLKVLILIALL